MLLLLVLVINYARRGQTRQMTIELIDVGTCGVFIGRGRKKENVLIGAKHHHLSLNYLKLNIEL